MQLDRFTQNLQIVKYKYQSRQTSALRIDKKRLRWFIFKLPKACERVAQHHHHHTQIASHAAAYI